MKLRTFLLVIGAGGLGFLGGMLTMRIIDTIAVEKAVTEQILHINQLMEKVTRR